jgi:hypothetical protein
LFIAEEAGDNDVGSGKDGGAAGQERYRTSKYPVYLLR